MEDCQIYEEGLAGCFDSPCSGGLDGGRSLCGFENQINGMLYTSLQAKAELQKRVLRAKLFDI